MPRIARVVVPEYPHHITQRGNNKSDIFIDNNDHQYFIILLREWLEKSWAELWAYCLMSNHFHLLVTPDNSDGLGKCLHGERFFDKLEEILKRDLKIKKAGRPCNRKT